MKQIILSLIVSTLISVPAKATVEYCYLTNWCDTLTNLSPGLISLTNYCSIPLGPYTNIDETYPPYDDYDWFEDWLACTNGTHYITPHRCLPLPFWEGYRPIAGDGTVPVPGGGGPPPPPGAPFCTINADGTVTIRIGTGRVLYQNSMPLTNGTATVHWPTNAPVVILDYALNGGEWTNQGLGLCVFKIPANNARLVAQPFLRPNYSIRDTFSQLTNIDGNDYIIGTLPHGSSWWHLDTNAIFRPHFFDVTQTDWSPSGQTVMTPGKGGLLVNPTDTEIEVTLWGAVSREAVTNHLPQGWSLAAHIDAESGPLDMLEFPADTNTIVIRWLPEVGQWKEYRATNSVPEGIPPLGWTRWGEDPPFLTPGEAVLVYQSTPKTWVQRGRPPLTIPKTPAELYGTNLWLEVIAFESTGDAQIRVHNCATEHDAMFKLQSSTNLTQWRVEAYWEGWQVQTNGDFLPAPVPPCGEKMFFRALRYQ